MHAWRESVLVEHFNGRGGGLGGCEECEPVLARLVGRIGVDHQCERSALAAVELRYLVMREHSEPMDSSVGQHSASKAVNLGATECHSLAQVSTTLFQRSTSRTAGDWYINTILMFSCVG